MDMWSEYGCRAELTWNVYGPDLNGRFGGLQGTGGLEAVILDADGTTTGVINDQFGNGIASVSGGSVTWYTTRVGAYGPLPGIQAQTLTDVSQVAAATAWRSRRIDPTGFYWLGARYYEPTSGRFLSADPMGQSSSPSLYDFAGGDPVNSFDPTGRCQKMIDSFGQDQATQNFLNLNFADVNAVNNFNAQNSAGGQNILGAGGNLLQGFGIGLQSAATGTLNALLDPFGAIQGLSDGLGNTVGRLFYDPGSVGTQVVNTVTDLGQLGNVLGNVTGGTIIGVGAGALGGAVIGQAADVGNVAAKTTSLGGTGTAVVPEYPTGSFCLNPDALQPIPVVNEAGEVIGKIAVRDLPPDFNLGPRGIIAPVDMPLGPSTAFGPSSSTVEFLTRFPPATPPAPRPW